MTNKIALSTLLIFFSFQIIAQYTITGTVTDDTTEEFLIGVHVQIEGTETGTLTDTGGKYSLETNKKEITLIFEYTGYVSQNVKIDATKKVHDIHLAQNLTPKEELIIAGYRTRGDYDRPPATRPRAVSSEKSARSIAIYESTVSSMKSGTLTAGEIHDFSKWKLWEDIAENELKKYQDSWKISLKHRYSVQVMNKIGVPIVDGEVKILNEKKEVLWASRTDNTGKAELWLNIFNEDTNLEETFQAEVVYNGNKHKIKKLKTFENGINTLKINTECNVPSEVDVMFVVDATSSMGDEISYLQIELENVIQRMQTENNDLNINLGSVFYRDHSDEYLTRKSDFSDNIDQTLEFIKTQNPSGGGDYPEAVEAGLDIAINTLQWSENAVARLLFLVLDAPPHGDSTVLAKLEQLMMEASKKGIRIIPVTASGVNKSTEYLMRSLALATNGTYTFLTDHSGIGNSHIEPTTDSYDVEKFNDLLIRLYKQYTVTPPCEGDFVYEEEEDKEPKEDNEEEKISLKYYPNPTTGNLTIELKEELEEIFITDASGKIIQRHTNLQAGKTAIDLSQFPSGMYFLKYIKGEQSGVERIVLIH